MKINYSPNYLKIRFDYGITIVSNHNAEIFFLNETAKKVYLGYIARKTQDEIITAISLDNPNIETTQIKEDVFALTDFLIKAKLLVAE